jgi:leucyl aminopeptidase (aminopeptidase T)
MSAVETLLELIDAELEAAVLRSGEDLQVCIDSVRRFVDQIGKERALSILREHLTSVQFSWGAVQQHSTQLIDAEEAQQASEERKTEAALQPFREPIDRMVKNWWRISDCASSSATQMRMTAKRGAIKRYCEGYVLAHGKTPSGTHNFVFPAFGRNRAVTVEFDELIGEER